MKRFKLQQGDSFVMNFVISENGTPQYLKSNEKIIVGFYDEFGCKKYIMKSDKIIKDNANIGHYAALVTSDITKNFIGTIDIEIAVYENSGNISHADKILEIDFEERKLNDEI